MCYLVFLSTTSADDLAVHNTDRMHFRRELPGVDGETASALLEHPNRWYIASIGNTCSCGFRHTMSPDLGFGVPEDWHPEESEHLDATSELVAVLDRLIKAGHRVDCLDVWTGTPVEEIRRLPVLWNGLNPGEFRFFENHHFVFE